MYMEAFGKHGKDLGGSIINFTIYYHPSEQSIPILVGPFGLGMG